MTVKKMALKVMVAGLLVSGSSVKAFDVESALRSFQVYSYPILAALVAHTWWNTGGEQDLNDAKAQAAAQLAKLDAKVDAVVDALTAETPESKARVRSRIAALQGSAAVAPAALKAAQ